MRRPTKSFAELCNEGDEHGVRQWLTWIHQKPEERVDHLNVPGAGYSRIGGAGYTGLMNAIDMGHTSIVNLLVKEPGMDFDFVSNIGKTALFVAVSRCNQVALDLLLTLPKGKVNLNIKSTTQSFEEVTPLMLAAEKGCLKSFQKLVVLDDIVLDTKNKRGASLKDVIANFPIIPIPDPIIPSNCTFFNASLQIMMDYEQVMMKNNRCTRCHLSETERNITISTDQLQRNIKMSMEQLQSTARLKKVRRERQKYEEEAAERRRRQMEESRAIDRRINVEEEGEEPKRKATNRIKKVIKENKERMEKVLKENAEMVEELVKENKAKEDKLAKENNAKKEKLLKENKIKQEKIAEENEKILERALKESESDFAKAKDQPEREKTTSATAPDCPVSIFTLLEVNFLHFSPGLL